MIILYVLNLSNKFLNIPNNEVIYSASHERKSAVIRSLLKSESEDWDAETKYCRIGHPPSTFTLRIWQNITTAGKIWHETCASLLDLMYFLFDFFILKYYTVSRVLSTVHYGKEQK